MSSRTSSPEVTVNSVCHWMNFEYLPWALFRCILVLMKLVRRIAALFVLVAWLPATTCCLLGAVLEDPGSNGCCSESQDQQNEHGDLGGCGICDTCESGDYLLSTQSIFIQGFHATLSCALLFPDRVVDSPVVASINTSRAPPDLARWQFFTRAALPGRSPSCFA